MEPDHPERLRSDTAELPTVELPTVPRPATAPPAAPDQLRPSAESDPEPDRLRNLVKLRLILAGVDPAEVDDVVEATAPTLLRTRLLWGDDQAITLAEVAERAGLDIEICRRARMLMGLPDPGDQPVCRTAEIDTFRGFAAGIELYGEAAILQFTRVLGSAMATVAEGALSVFGRQLADHDQPPEGDQYVLAAFDALESFRIVPEVMGVIAKLQFDLATDRLDGEPGQMQVGSVGFVDLTGSTKATERLGADAMAPALTRFEEWAAELAVGAGGRVVKYIGDEVMFLSPDLVAATGVAIELIDRVGEDPVLRSARAGVAHGPLLSRDGDWYGSTVNLAARLVDRAKPGAVLLAGEGASEVPGAVARGRRRIREPARAGRAVADRLKGLGMSPRTDWNPALREEFDKPYWSELQQFVETERDHHTVYPSRDEVFAALHLTHLAEVKVLILGQDPYHGPGQAHGLCFSVRSGTRPPPSLLNIFTELHDDLGIERPATGDLTPWARQGVLLLNVTLTVRAGQAASHQGKGWERFTDEVIRVVDDKPERVVFILWGNSARKKRSLIDTSRHVVIESPHPSPLSAHRGFFGSKPFSRANEALVAAGRDPVDWRL